MCVCVCVCAREHGKSVVASNSQQSGAVEACWAHNPEVDGSKPSSASLFKILSWCVFIFLYYNLQLPPDMDQLWNTKLRTTAGYCRNSGSVSSTEYVCVAGVHTW